MFLLSFFEVFFLSVRTMRMNQVRISIVFGRFFLYCNAMRMSEIPAGSSKLVTPKTIATSSSTYICCWAAITASIICTLCATVSELEPYKDVVDAGFGFVSFVNDFKVNVCRLMLFLTVGAVYGSRVDSMTPPGPGRPLGPPMR